MAADISAQHYLRKQDPGTSMAQKPAIGRLLRAIAICCLGLGHIAAVSSADLQSVEVSPAQGAALPAGLKAVDPSGAVRDVRDLIDRPSVFIFADYTCATLCGPVLSFVANALDNSGLKPGDDFKLVVMGLDPKDTAQDARDMQRSRLGDNAMLSAATVFLTANADQVKAATAALGYRYSYDAAHDQFAHPAAAYVLTADGHVARVLTGIGLTGSDMRLALVEAGRGAIGNITDRIHLLCYGFDPAHGAYNLAVSRILSVTALVTVLALGGGIGLLIWAGPRPQA
jgi:protein SCO1/2